MIYLAFCVPVLVLFHQLLRFSQVRGQSVVAMAAVNYVVAAIVSLALLLTITGPVGLYRDATLAVLGVTNGVLYFAHLLVVLRAYHAAGVGVTTALMASGVIVAILASWLLWREPMSPARWTAVALLPIAITLMRPRGNALRPTSLVDDLVLVMVFLIAGIQSVIHKWASDYSAVDFNVTYQATLFATAAVTSVGYVLIHRLPTRRADVRTGVFVGIVNVAATLLLVATLAHLPGVIAFPTVGCLTIVLNLVIARLVWRERLARRQVAGISAAMVVIVLANIGVRAPLEPTVDHADNAPVAPTSPAPPTL